MRVISGTAGFVSLIAVVFLSGCASPWPANMPPVTYSGTVYNEVTHRPEPDAAVMAMRAGHTPGLLPGSFLVPIDDFGFETMAEVHSAKDGEFTLTTSTGYAEWLVAKSHDGKLTGRLEQDLKQGSKDLEIKIEPPKP
jgi:hypothetical protein